MCGGCKKKVSFVPLSYPETLVNPENCLSLTSEFEFVIILSSLIFFLSYWLNYSWIFEDKSEFQLFVIPNKNLVVYIISLQEVTHQVNFHQKVG